MTESIKLTEPILIWELCEILPQYEVPQFVCYFLRKEDLDNYIKGHKKCWQYGSGKLDKATAQQILDYHKVVNAIKKQNESDMIETWYATDEYSNMINTLVKDATGKDIKDL